MSQTINFITSLFFIFITSVCFAKQAKPTKQPEPTFKKSDWVTEAGTMLVAGEAAKALYFSLKAKPKVQKVYGYKIKKNKFAECWGYFENPQATEEMLKFADCQIKAPKGTVTTY